MIKYKFGLQKLRGGAEVNVNEARNKCRGCSADIHWAVTTNHKIMPVSFVDGEWISHFAICPNAKILRINFMKIYIPNNSQQTLGGGWTFIRNFQKGMKKLGYDFSFTREAADIVLINGASMTDPHEVEEAKKLGKKIVFRVDNIPKKSRKQAGPGFIAG